MPTRKRPDVEPHLLAHGGWRSFADSNRGWLGRSRTGLFQAGCKGSCVEQTNRSMIRRLNEIVVTLGRPRDPSAT